MRRTVIAIASRNGGCSGTEKKSDVGEDAHDTMPPPDDPEVAELNRRGAALSGQECRRAAQTCCIAMDVTD
ncbi:hypothetical protein [Psychromicrobium sp. YIM B11713]|uniref:hypothetical protein n=1 Tax=Psychromicrobium sp. YIM B11713 TaxID=3145233 RepID=UPI00374EE0EC